MVKNGQNFHQPRTLYVLTIAELVFFVTVILLLIFNIGYVVYYTVFQKNRQISRKIIFGHRYFRIWLFSYRILRMGKMAENDYGIRNYVNPPKQIVYRKLFGISIFYYFSIESIDFLHTVFLAGIR